MESYGHSLQVGAFEGIVVGRLDGLEIGLGEVELVYKRIGGISALG